MNKLLALTLLGILFPLSSSLPATATTLPPVRPSTAFAVSAVTTPRLLGSYVREVDLPTWCSEMGAYGVRFTWTTIPWDAIEPTKGTFVWTKADQVIQMIRSCGFDMGVHVLSRSSWGTYPPPPIPSQDTASMPLIDLNDYYDFVYRLASHFKGQVSRYSIENEAHAYANWPASIESCFQMLPVAYQAVKAGDPGAIVEDSALSSSALGVIIANDMLNAGNTQGAISFASGYFANYGPGLTPLTINNLQDLQALLSYSDSQRAIQWAPLLYASSQYFDVEQLHYFAPWSYLTTVTNWVHNQLQSHGGDKSLDFWEMGYGWDDTTTYDPQAHARDEIKLFATALGEGGLRALQWQFSDYTDSLGQPGLITPSGPRPAAESYLLLTQNLNGATSPQRLNLGPSVWGYSFATGAGTVYVVWSASPTTVSLPINSPRARVTAMTGKESYTNPTTIPVSDSPVFVNDGGSYMLYLPLAVR